MLLNSNDFESTKMTTKSWEDNLTKMFLYNKKGSSLDCIFANEHELLTCIVLTTIDISFNTHPVAATAEPLAVKFQSNIMSRQQRCLHRSENVLYI